MEGGESQREELAWVFPPFQRSTVNMRTELERLVTRLSDPQSISVNDRCQADFAVWVRGVEEIGEHELVDGDSVGVRLALSLGEGVVKLEDLDVVRGIA